MRDSLGTEGRWGTGLLGLTIVLGVSCGGGDSAPLGVEPEAVSWTHARALQAQDPSVAVAPDGRALAAWAQPASPFSVVRAQWLVTNAPEVQLSDPGVTAWTPKVAVDSAGGAVAVWVQYDGGIRARVWGRRWNGSGWEAVQQISTNGAGDASVAEVGCDGAGNAIAVWHQGNGMTNHFDVVASSFSPVGGVWSNPILLSDGVNSAWLPLIAMNSAGEAMALWHQDEGDGSVSNGPRDPWARPYHGSAWGTAVQINTVSGATSYVKGQAALALDPNGNSVALWIQRGASGSGPEQVWSATHPVAGNWGSGGIVSASEVGDAFTPDLDLDASGNAVAVWQQQDGVSAAIASSTRAWGGPWSEPQILSSGDDAFAPQVAAGPNGQATVVWYQQGTTGFTVWSCTLSEGIGSAPIPLDSFVVDPTLFFPVLQVAADAAGTAQAVWGLDEM